MANNNIPRLPKSDLSKYRGRTLGFGAALGFILILYIWFWIQNPKTDGYGYT